jgi:hypothetical protein
MTGAAVGGAAAAGGAAAGSGAAAVATGAAAAIGTKAAAGLATAAIIAGGAAEIQNVTATHPSRPQTNKRHVANANRTPAPTPAATQPPAPAAPPVATPATDAPATPATPPQPTQTVTVPPQSDEGATTSRTTSNFPIGKHRKHKGNAVANTDSRGTSTTPQTAPVVTGVEPGTCDADGDGVVDTGAPSSCSTGTTGTTSTGDGLVEGSLQPAQPAATPRRSHRGSTGGTKTAKKKSAPKKRR